MAEHKFKFVTGHLSDLEAVDILDKGNNWRKRNISETLELKMEEVNATNHRSDTQGLSKKYTNVLHTYKGKVKELR